MRSGWSKTFERELRSVSDDTEQLKLSSQKQRQELNEYQALTNKRLDDIDSKLSKFGRFSLRITQLFKKLQRAPQVDRQVAQLQKENRSIQESSSIIRLELERVRTNNDYLKNELSVLNKSSEMNQKMISHLRDGLKQENLKQKRDIETSKNSANKIHQQIYRKLKKHNHAIRTLKKHNLTVDESIIELIDITENQFNQQNEINQQVSTNNRRLFRVAWAIPLLSVLMIIMLGYKITDSSEGNLSSISSTIQLLQAEISSKFSRLEDRIIQATPPQLQPNLHQHRYSHLLV